MKFDKIRTFFANRAKPSARQTTLLCYALVFIILCGAVGLFVPQEETLVVNAKQPAIQPVALSDYRMSLMQNNINLNAGRTPGEVEAIASATISKPKAVERAAYDAALDHTFDADMLGLKNSQKAVRWQGTNGDTRGWLTVDGTNINYPVVIGPYNDYYLSMGYYKQYSFDGVIWADAAARFGNSSTISDNTVIYGHNWYNCWAPLRIGDPADTMFEQLPSFDYLDFAQQNQTIRYSTTDEDMVFKIFAVFYTEIDFDYIQCNPSKAGLQYIIDEARARSVHDYNIDVNSSDKIVTLSTCTRIFGNSDRQRFVVMGRLLRPGESQNQRNLVTDNPGYKRPSNLW